MPLITPTFDETLRSHFEELANAAAVFTPQRSKRLFQEFLPMGYRMTMASSVAESLADDLLLTKVRIGTLITLYDDLADNPKLRNKTLLQRLYQIPFVSCGSRDDETALEVFIRGLYETIVLTIKTFPQYALLAPAFEFDVQQFFNANRYSELISDAPFLSNTSEKQSYLPHNMGIVLVGTLDLMASPMINLGEIGALREMFFEAQVAARRMNMLTTYERERAEGDVTNEFISLSASEAQGVEEGINAMLASLRCRYSHLKSMSASGYSDGMRSLLTLHKNFQGAI